MKKKYYLFKMNDFTIGVLPFIILFLVGGLFYLINPLFAKETLNVLSDDPFTIFILIFLYCVIHEIFHSLAYIIHRKPFNKIVYGVALEKGVFYCLCKQNIERNIILRSLLYPFFFLGIITLVISIIFKLPILAILSIYNISGCSGDLVMFAFILKLNKNIEFSEFDDPLSFALYSDSDLSHIKCFGLKYLESKNNIERNDLTKIKVSKQSLKALIIIIILYIIYKLLGV